MLTDTANMRIRHLFYCTQKATLPGFVELFFKQDSSKQLQHSSNNSLYLYTVCPERLQKAGGGSRSVPVVQQKPLLCPQTRNQSRLRGKGTVLSQVVVQLLYTLHCPHFYIAFLLPQLKEPVFGGSTHHPLQSSLSPFPYLMSRCHDAGATQFILQQATLITYSAALIGVVHAL